MGSLIFAYQEDFSSIDVEVEQGHFRGHGFVYPQVDKIEKFINDIRAYPLQQAGLFLENPGRLAISVRQSDLAGHFMMEVEVAEADNPTASLARVFLKFDYTQIQEFSRQLRAMLDGRLEWFILKQLP